MKRLILTGAFLAWAPWFAGAPASASAPTWLERVSSVAGERVGTMEVPDVGGAAPFVGGVMTASLDKESRTLYGAARPWAGKLIRVDQELDGLYDEYRGNPSKDAADRIDAARKERDYYAGIWRGIVEPSKNFKNDDPRIAPILQALYYYLNPLPARVERLEQEKTDAAKKVESARDRARAESARLHEDDRKIVEELGLTGRGFDAVEAAISADRRESREYMGWVRSAHDKTAEWAVAVKVNESFAEQYSWVYVDYTAHSKLVNLLQQKKFGAFSAS